MQAEILPQQWQVLMLLTYQQEQCQRFTSDAPDNFINFSNEKYDELFKEAIAETDDNKKTELYKEMEKILAEEAANVYIQDLANLVAVSDKFGGYEFYPLYVQDMSKMFMVEQIKGGRKQL